MANPSAATRQSLVKAATALFAQHGYDGASVRAIVTKARANQAAINYHFGGKEGLYLEVLKAAFETFTRGDREAGKRDELPREQALRSFVRQQLRPLQARDDLSRYLQIFTWESIRPSKVLRQFMVTSAAPFMNSAIALVRRFLPPDSTDRQAMCAAIWLLGQCSVFVRNREHFAHPPFGLKIDDAFVEWLTDLVTGLAVGGLSRMG
jgi:TetR/AcrR family transcriptional regulator, regulator of cefoperazone and chloramphenicol sensitivity